MPSALEQIDLPLSLGGMGFLLFCLLGVAVDRGARAKGIAQ